MDLLSDLIATPMDLLVGAFGILAIVGIVYLIRRWYSRPIK
jgi:hypothetical protein